MYNKYDYRPNIRSFTHITVTQHILDMDIGNVVYNTICRCMCSIIIFPHELSFSMFSNNVRRGMSIQFDKVLSFSKASVQTKTIIAYCECIVSVLTCKQNVQFFTGTLQIMRDLHSACEIFRLESQSFYHFPEFLSPVEFSGRFEACLCQSKMLLPHS